MESIYEKSKDLHIRKYVVYGKEEDTKLYADSSYKKTVSKTVLEEAFLLGALLVVDNNEYTVPVSYADGTVKTLSYDTSMAFKSWTASAE